MFELHPNQGIADIHARVRLDLLDGYRTFGVFVDGHREGTARVRLRYNVDNLGSRQEGFFFDDDRAVQMLAALRGKVDSLRFQYARHAFVDGCRRVDIRAFADPQSHHFTGAAADDQNVALL